eukprot:1001705-Amphidinium_carterae.1
MYKLVNPASSPASAAIAASLAFRSPWSTLEPADLSELLDLMLQPPCVGVTQGVKVIARKAQLQP